MDELIGHDYVSKPLSELMNYEEFSPHAFRVVNAIMNMKTSQLEKIDLLGVFNGPN